MNVLNRVSSVYRSSHGWLISRRLNSTISSQAADLKKVDQQPESTSASELQNDAANPPPPSGSNRTRVRHGRAAPISQSTLPAEWEEYRTKYPEFLPWADYRWRNRITEKLERRDMMRRRSVIDIPEFYVGSILKVTISDPSAPGKESFFVGICIFREFQGLRHAFTLRNYVENQGVEIRYDLYNPTIRSIEVLRLEKRLDDQLIYLRDSDQIHSTFPFDMQPEPLPAAGQPVPVNPLRVKMKVKPWSKRWEVHDLRGIERLEMVPDWLYNRARSGNRLYWDPDGDKYNILQHYIESIPEEDQYEVWKEVDSHEKEVMEKRKSERRKRLILEADKGKSK